MSFHQYLDMTKFQVIQWSESEKGTLFGPDLMADLSLVCIVLIIGLELNVMKESFTTRESTYIELIFRKAIVQFACAKTNCSKIAKYCQKKPANMRTLSPG